MNIVQQNLSSVSVLYGVSPTAPVAEEHSTPPAALQGRTALSGKKEKLACTLGTAFCVC